MADEFGSAFVQAVHRHAKLLFRAVEHEEVFFGRARSRKPAHVARELNVPVTTRWADERAVVAVMTREPTKVVETQDLDVEAKGDRKLTYRPGHSHGGRRERLSTHDLQSRRRSLGTEHEALTDRSSP